MSVFGGDSWGREAQDRKRRVDDLIAETIDSSAFKKLSNGKFICIICPHNPTIHTPLMFSAHIKGSKHLAAAAKLQEKEVAITNEMSKRIALSHNYSFSSNTGVSSVAPQPLIAKTRQAASEVIGDRSSKSCVINKGQDVQSYIACSLNSTHVIEGALPVSSLNSTHVIEGALPVSSLNSTHVIDEGALLVSSLNCTHVMDERSSTVSLVSRECLKNLPGSQELRERGLKFTSAGWKRDGHGRWFKDENVEFDSDEEDPNEYFTR